MGKILTSLAAMLFAFQANCAATTVNVKPKPEIRQQSKAQQDLGDIAKSIYCIRTKTTYKNLLDRKMEPMEYSKHGTGFVFAEKDGWYYIITNQHVVDGDNNILGEDDVDDIDSMFMALFSLYEKSGEKTTIVDYKGDKKPGDDIELEEVVKSEELDVAILRTKKKLHVAKGYEIGNPSELRYGDTIYTVGFPFGSVKALTKGIISNPGDNLPNAAENENKIIDTTYWAGNSGSPYFVMKDNKLYWVGISGRCFINHTGDCAGLAIGTDITKFQDMMDKALGKGEKK
ncbi:serine protease [Candidatus Woesearchaeota archaeon]|nr:serine protease [Candidatus Woesearchaeota archaeon]